MESCSIFTRLLLTVIKVCSLFFPIARMRSTRDTRHQNVQSMIDSNPSLELLAAASFFRASHRRFRGFNSLSIRQGSTVVSSAFWDGECRKIQKLRSSLVSSISRPVWLSVQKTFEIIRATESVL